MRSTPLAADGRAVRPSENRNCLSDARSLLWLGDRELRRSLRSPLTAGGLIAGLLWLWYLWSTYVIGLPVLFRLDQVLAGAALPPAAAAGLLVALRAHADKEAGSWLRTSPLPSATRTMGWFGATLPLAVGASLLTFGGVLYARISGGATGSPRPAALAVAPLLVLLFGALGALLGSTLPARAATLAVMALTVAVAAAGRGSAQLQSLSPWRTYYEVTVTSAISGGDPLAQVCSVAGATVGLTAIMFAVVDRRRRIWFAAAAFVLLAAASAFGATARRATLASADEQSIRQVVSGAAATSCDNGTPVRICNLPGWEQWRPFWREIAARVMEVLPHGDRRLLLRQSGAQVPAGRGTGLTVRLRPTDSADLSLYLSGRRHAEELEGTVAAWLTGRRTVPLAWTANGSGIATKRCLDNSDAAAAALWIMGRANPEVGRSVAVNASQGFSSELGAIDVGPRAVALAARLLQLDHRRVASAIIDTMPELRAGHDVLAARLTIDRPRVPDDGLTAPNEEPC